MHTASTRQNLPCRPGLFKCMQDMLFPANQTPLILSTKAGGEVFSFVWFWPFWELWGVFFSCGGGSGLFPGTSFTFELMIGWRTWGNPAAGRWCPFGRPYKSKKVTSYNCRRQALFDSLKRTYNRDTMSTASNNFCYVCTCKK